MVSTVRRPNLRTLKIPPDAAVSLPDVALENMYSLHTLPIRSEIHPYTIFHVDSGSKRIQICTHSRQGHFENVGECASPIFSLRQLSGAEGSCKLTYHPRIPENRRSEDEKLRSLKIPKCPIVYMCNFQIPTPRICVNMWACVQQSGLERYRFPSTSS